MDGGSFSEHDIPSLSASAISAFDPERSTHSAYSNRSAMHSSSRWSAQEPEESDQESDGPWQPPAWQKSSNNHWYRKSLLGDSAMRSSPSRSPSYYDRSDRDVTPSRIPLPESPLKHTPRTSPEPEHERRYTTENIASRMQSPSVEPQGGADAPQSPSEEVAMSLHEHEAESAAQDGYIRFAVRGETLFRTAPIEDSISVFTRFVHACTSSPMSIISTLFTITLAWLLVQPWTSSGLVPDVANVAGFVKQLSPLLYASENVIPRSRELAEASIAVQDLGESVRATNMSASTTIIDQLDDLGDNLKVLSEQMTSFFTNVDGDVDSILITMEWAKRELTSIQGPKTGLIDAVIGNVHGALGKAGLLERNGVPTAIGRTFSDVMGQTSQQRSKATLQRTFDYLLSTLEENISNELARADVLFTLFESVDRQFQNLHRSVAKEEDSLATKKDEFLASMWRSSIGNQLKLKKYEKNLKLLKSVRASTLTNKSELKSHIQIIQSVKEQLDKARRNLVSPLIRRAQSNSIGLEQQLEDLTGTYGFLKGVRDEQKQKVLQQLWAEPKKRVTIGTAHEDDHEIEEEAV